MAKMAICAMMAAAAVLLMSAPASAQTGFIRVSEGQFVDDSCEPFYFSGYNTWQILETAGGSCCGGRASVQSQLDQAQAANLTVVRMFAYGVGYNYQLQEAPGQVNASAFQDLDFIISEAGKRNLKLLVSLASNWVYGVNTTGTKCYYTNYTTTASGCDDFFADANAITLYKDWVKTIATRNNSITGVTYGNDPTIFAWDLINEPRCTAGTVSSCSAAAIQSWITNVSAYVKSQVKQLVTVGEDGFMQASNCLADKTNPVTNSIGWPLETGQDFIPNHAVSTIDFASIHFWPDNWGRTDLDFGKSWMTTHINQSDIVLKKPLIVEEFGKAFGGNDLSSGQGQTAAQQMDYYKLVYSIVETSIDTTDVVKGIAFWRWSAAASPTNGLAAFDNYATINTTSDVFTQVIGPFSQRIAQKVASPAGKVAGCTSGSGSQAPTTASSVAGRRLMQAAAPSSSAANANSLIPASLCGAFPPQPSSVGR